MATVLITGANRGIGRALAERYLARGDKVIAAVRGSCDLNGVEIVKADVTDEASLATAARAIAGRPIDILVCNAGVNAGRGALDAENSHDMWARLFATNVAGVFFTARTFAPNVIAAKGRIAIISSRMGSSKAAAGNSYAYRASKAAASNIAANLAVELKPKGVAVASYHPGWVKTDMGGSGADIDTATSAAGLIKSIDELTLDTTGAFTNYDGSPIAY